MNEAYSFGSFRLSPANRRLERDGQPIDVQGRYFDALHLLVRYPDQLVSKDQFMGEVWRGVPVTDEALTQCIRTLRRELGDNAASPAFIETVPKHGYRFIAPVAMIAAKPDALAPAALATRDHGFATTAAAGTVGGGFAGVIGGILYGFVGTSRPTPDGIGALSVLLVLLGVTMLVALTGGLGVSIGVAAADRARPNSLLWLVTGGAAGGLVVGAITKMFGLDAFNLLIGHAPSDITGAGEGLAVGAAVGLGAWLARRVNTVRAATAMAGVVGASSGLIIGLAGGNLMLGSLAALSRDVPGSRLRLDQLGAMAGEHGLGPVVLIISCILEAGLFAACVVGAMALARRWNA